MTHLLRTQDSSFSMSVVCPGLQSWIVRLIAGICSLVAKQKLTSHERHMNSLQMVVYIVHILSSYGRWAAPQVSVIICKHCYPNSLLTAGTFRRISALTALYQSSPHTSYRSPTYNLMVMPEPWPHQAGKRSLETHSIVFSLVSSLPPSCPVFLA